MKKLITLLAAGILAGAMVTGAYAQAAGPNGGGVQSGGANVAKQKGKAHSPIAQKILKQLNLTPDQKKQVVDLVKQFQQKRQQETASGAKPDRKEMAADRKQFLEDLGKILTPEQKEKLKELMEQAKKKKGAGKSIGTGATGTGTTGTGTAGGGSKTGGGL
ncbi:MAG TPA: hypothetical protein VHE55_16325 [Fimbriimonadaceae bacterium]|nr:hypothetical protein [Fimbriimonadaceae bacterium]